MHENPYQYSPGGEGPSEARTAVQMPAICLMVVATICIVLTLLSVAFSGFLLLSGTAARMEQPAGMSKETQIVIRLAWEFVLLFASCYVFYGALQMKNLRNYSVAYAAAVVASIPCVGPCCLLGIPFGIWSIVVLQREEVHRAFR